MASGLALSACASRWNLRSFLLRRISFCLCTRRIQLMELCSLVHCTAVATRVQRNRRQGRQGPAQSACATHQQGSCLVLLRNAGAERSACTLPVQLELCVFSLPAQIYLFSSPWRQAGTQMRLRQRRCTGTTLRAASVFLSHSRKSAANSSGQLAQTQARHSSPALFLKTTGDAVDRGLQKRLLKGPSCLASPGQPSPARAISIEIEKESLAC